MKKLSIGIPTYNRKDELFNLVSGLTQTIQEQNLECLIEVLVVDMKWFNVRYISESLVLKKR